MKKWKGLSRCPALPLRLSGENGPLGSVFTCHLCGQPIVAVLDALDLPWYVHKERVGR